MKLLRLVLMLFPLWVNAQKKTVAFQPANLSIDWQLVTNHHNGEDQFLYTLTLTNTDKKLSLPATGWTIYYNANRDVIKKDVGHGLEMFRVHGDLFYLRPTTNFKGIKPGESIVLQCIGDAWAFNISDAPAGYYWVWDNAPTTSIAITKTTARPPADINKFKRSPNQPNDQITPQMVFEQNKSIVDIPAEQLPRILPTPVSYLEQAGSFTITASTTIVSEGAFEQEARYLADELEVFLGAKLSVGTISSNTIVFRTDASLAPDLTCALVALSTALPMRSRFTRIGILRHKESDRVEGLKALAEAQGAQVEVNGDTMTVRPGGAPRAFAYDARDDHRLAMAAVTASVLNASALTLTGAESVAKSFPRFFDEVGL